MAKITLLFSSNRQAAERNHQKNMLLRDVSKHLTTLKLLHI